MLARLAGPPGMNLGKIASVYALLFSSMFFGAQRFSYAGFMVKEFYPHLDHSEVGYYAGLLSGAWFLGQAFNGFPMGHLADAMGVMPLMLVTGLAGVVFPLVFGFAPNFWIATGTCFVYGALNGTLPLSKVRIYDVLSPEATNFASSYIALVWGFTSVIGPSVGGYLSYPAEKYSSLDFPILRQFPFALPNILCSCFGVISLVLLVRDWWEERRVAVPPLIGASPSAGLPSFTSYIQNNTTQVVLSSAVYATCGGMHMIMTEVFPLFLMLPITAGGFGLSTDGIGTMGMVQGLFVIVAAVVCPVVNEKLGYRESVIYTTLVSIVFVVVVPWSVSASRGHAGLAIASFFMGIARQGCGQLGITAGTILTNFSTARPYLARVNGAANSLSAMMRFVIPAVACAIFAWSSSSGMPYPFNQHLMFIAYGFVALGIVAIAYRLRPERNFPSEGSASQRTKFANVKQPLGEADGEDLD